MRQRFTFLAAFAALALLAATAQAGLIEAPLSNAGGGTA